jgi:arylformamidase
MPVRNGMDHWPGDPEVSVERLRRIAHGDEYNLTAIAMSAHTGTHVDAPLHFLDGAASIDGMPLDALIGPALVVDGTSAPVDPAERVLFRCGSEIVAEVARALVAARTRAVGIDSLSIGDSETHRILLGGGVWIIEGLDLSAVLPGHYHLVCLPLKIEGADGAPARALLRALI